MSNLSPQHHPDQNLLVEFAAGTLDHGQAIAISTHLHYCVRCRNEVAKLERIGRAMISMMTSHSHTPQAKSSDTQFEQLMTRIDTQETHKPQPSCPPQQEAAPLRQHGDLPTVIRKMLHKPTKWQRVTASLSSTSLVAGQNKYGISLQRISAGGRVPQHDHRGTEITVVLKGSFSDEDNVYQQGDFLLKNAGDIHRPMAASNEDCLCLSVEQAPVKLTGIFSRFLNPFLRIQAV